MNSIAVLNVAPGVDAQHPWPGAVIDRGELVVLASRAGHMPAAVSPSRNIETAVSTKSALRRNDRPLTTRKMSPTIPHIVTFHANPRR